MKNIKNVFIIYISVLIVIFMISSCSSANVKQIENLSEKNDAVENDVETVPIKPEDKQKNNDEEMQNVSDAIQENGNKTIYDKGFGSEEIHCIHSVVSYHIPGGFEYDNSYHTISGDLIDQVGNDEFVSWIKKEENSCESINIVKFTEYFNFDKLLFQTLINTKTSLYYRFDYNTDIIYSGDTDLIEKYYTSGMDRIGDIITRKYLLSFKSDLLSYLMNECGDKFSEWIKQKNLNNDWKYFEISDSIEVSFDGDIRQWSIAEVITTFNIPKDVVEKAKINTDQAVSACTFDIELLYDVNKCAEIKEELFKLTDYPSIDPVIYDSKFISFDYDKQVEKWNKIANGMSPSFPSEDDNAGEAIEIK